MYLKQCSIPEGDTTFIQTPEVIIIISNTVQVCHRVKIYFFTQNVIFFIAKIPTLDFTKKIKIDNLQLLNGVWNIAA